MNLPKLNCWYVYYWDNAGQFEKVKSKLSYQAAIKVLAKYRHCFCAGMDYERKRVIK